jgi:hypothetical protein
VFFFNALLHKTPFQELAPTKSNLKTRAKKNRNKKPKGLRTAKRVCIFCYQERSLSNPGQPKGFAFSATKKEAYQTLTHRPQQKGKKNKKSMYGRSHPSKAEQKGIPTEENTLNRKRKGRRSYKKKLIASQLCR